MATPAEVANDMAAHATYWYKRDKIIWRACAEAAAMIRAMLAGQYPDGRTFYGLHRRLLKLEGHDGHYKGYPDFTRARWTLETLNRGRGR